MADTALPRRSKSDNFDPDDWIDDWLSVGAIIYAEGKITIGAPLDGNKGYQQSLLSKLDAHGWNRRLLVRQACLRRFARDD